MIRCSAGVRTTAGTAISTRNQPTAAAAASDIDGSLARVYMLERATAEGDSVRLSIRLSVTLVIHA